jgi:hypothetical protein
VVLDGALELELSRSKFPLIIKSSVIAFASIFILAFLFTWLFYYLGNVPVRTALVNAIPFCVICSAIAIPSIRNLSAHDKEFLTYESSFSDIFGVLLFNFIALNEFINGQSYWNFGLQLLLIIGISFVAVLSLSFLLSRISHHITYTPIILLVILIYTVSKVYNLPGLIFILVFGLFLGNLDELKRYKWIEKFRPEKLDKEVAKCKEITIEATFLIRALFFMLLGFLMDVKEFLNAETLPWAVGIVICIVMVRWIILEISNLPVIPLLFVAPRGLITILLFLAILPELNFVIVNKSLIIQTIILSALVMMFGLLITKKVEVPEIQETT